MSQEQSAGCVRPAAASVAAVETKSQEAGNRSPVAHKKEESMIHVGRKAPDFSAPGYHQGTFVNDVKLSDYFGKWVILCFYPGDFTFV